MRKHCRWLFVFVSTAKKRSKTRALFHTIVEDRRAFAINEREPVESESLGAERVSGHVCGYVACGRQVVWGSDSRRKGPGGADQAGWRGTVPVSHRSAGASRARQCCAVPPLPLFRVNTSYVYLLPWYIACIPNGPVTTVFVDFSVCRGRLCAIQWFVNR